MKPAGSFQPAAQWASCAAEPCDDDATIEALHKPTEDVAVWVPLCDRHKGAILRGEGIEYLVEIHGFVPALGDVDEES